METKWRSGCFMIPSVLFTMCVLSTLLLTDLTPSDEENNHIPTQTDFQNGLQIQILDRPFTRLEAMSGEPIYQENCAACHGIDGEGQFPQAPLEPDSTGRIGAPPHNETGHTWHHTDTLLLRYVKEGGFANPERFYTMPAFGDILTEEEIWLVIAYIKTMWTNEQRLMQRRSTEEEERLFSE